MTGSWRVLPRSRLARPLFGWTLSVFLLIGSGTAVLGLYQARLSRDAVALHRNLQQTLLLGQELLSAVEAQITVMHRYLAMPAPELGWEFDELNFRIGEQQTRYLLLDLSDEQRLAIDRIKSLQTELASQARVVFQLPAGSSPESVSRRLADVDTARARLLEEFRVLQRIQGSELTEALERSRAVSRVATTFSFVVGAAFLLLIGALGWLLGRRVLAPVQGLLQAARRVRRGDLESRARAQRDDEIGELAGEFNYMVEALDQDRGRLEERIRERTGEVHKLQRQLVQSAKMSAIGQLVSGVAHELNNPLTAIVGLAELNQTTSRSGQGEDIAEIAFQAERCRRIVANLLQFSREQRTQKEIVDLNAEIRRVTAMRDYDVSTHGIQLQHDLTPAAPALAGDPVKIQQVVIALLNNAIDAIEENGPGGHITIRTRARGDTAELEISDDGGGMSEPDRVFEPFFTTKPEGRGTGLGLSVAYGIVQEHGGGIRAENRAGGACFTITLPRAVVGLPSGGDPRPATPPEPGPIQAVGSALVVDDEEILQRLQSRLLEGLGLHAACVASGEAAIEFLERSSVDLVISDIRMPGAIDGLALYAWIEQHRPELRHRFLLTSGDLVRLQEGDPLPVPCLRKPFSRAEYTRGVRHALGTSAEVP